MRKQTDLAAMKQLARVFLMMDPEPTSFSPVIIKHPFTDSGIVTVRSGNEYRAADITADEAVRSQWREQMASLIENAETPRHIYMMLTKSYRFAFLKYAMPYFSQKDFSEYLANAWVMCESPNNDPNFTQKQMLGLFKKADPQVLMDEDEYKQFQALEDNPKRYGADPAFLFIIAYAVAQELNEIKLNKSLAAAKQALKLTAGEVRINCFNGLTIHGSKGTLSEKDFISSRCYTLLSYLAVTAGNRATANQLALILWPDESCEIPMKSVRNIAYRLRSLLGYVGLEDLVVYANGIFSFNPEIKVVTDVGLFEELCDSIEMENNPKKRYRLYEAAVGLYSGNLLPRLSDNIYFIPSITYYQGLYFRLAGRYIERQTECGEYVYAHKAAKAALAFDPFNSSLNMHLTILLYQQSGAGTANAFYTGIKRHLTEAHIQRIKQTCPNMII